MHTSEVLSEQEIHTTGFQPAKPTKAGRKGGPPLTIEELSSSSPLF